MWRPGTRIVFKAGGPSHAPLLQSLDLDDRMPLAMHDIAERILTVQGQGRTAKRVFINRNFWLRQVDHWRIGERSILRSRYFSRRYYRGKHERRLFGVPITWSTSTRTPFYVVDDKGNKIV